MSSSPATEETTKKKPTGITEDYDLWRSYLVRLVIIIFVFAFLCLVIALSLKLVDCNNNDDTFGWRLVHDGSDNEIDESKKKMNKIAFSFQSETPTPRAHSCCSSSPIGNIVGCFGGETMTLDKEKKMNAKTLKGDFWVWSKRNWYNLQMNANPENVIPFPIARRNSACWFVNDSTFFLFGGETIDGDLLGDFWVANVNYIQKYSTWTLLHRGEKMAAFMDILSTNVTKNVDLTDNFPTARAHASFSIDGLKRLWLFGGHSYNLAEKGYYEVNDLWYYSNNKWSIVWICNVKTHCLEKRKSPLSSPLCKQDSALWITESFDYGIRAYVYGGIKIDSNNVSLQNEMTKSNSSCYDIELWKWNIDRWEYIPYLQSPIPEKNSMLLRRDCQPLLPTYSLHPQIQKQHPGSRIQPCAWMHKDRSLWFFGGSVNTQNIMADTWSFYPKEKIWKWETGPIFANVPGVLSSHLYLNNPPALMGSSHWTSAKGQFCIAFGVDYSGVYHGEVWCLNS